MIESDYGLPDSVEDMKDMSDNERFGWILVGIIFLDMFLFMVYTNFMAPVCITILEVMFLNYLGKIWKIRSWRNMFYGYSK